MNPANGQIIDNVSKLDSLVDLKGKNLKFKQDKEVEGDIVYIAKGSDGKNYSAQLEKKTLIVSIYDTPKEKVEKKAIEERSEKLVQGGKITGDLDDAKDNEGIKEPKKENSKDKKDLDKIVNELDKPVLNKNKR